MSQFRELVGNFLIAGIMFASLFGFLIILQEKNDAPQPLIEDETFNLSFGRLIETINISTREADEKYGKFNEETPRPGFGSIVLFGIVAVGKTFSGIIFGLFKAILILPLIFLGIPETIYNIILTLLIITTIVSVWLLYKLGG